MTTPVPYAPQANIYGEYEQDVRDSDERLAAVGGDYQIANRGRLYFRDEFISSLSGPYSLNSVQKQNATVFGVDTDYMQDSRVFSEYRIRQTDFDRIVVEIGGRSELSTDEIAAITTFLKQRAGEEFSIEVKACPQIDWGESRKRPGFRCEV